MFAVWSDHLPSRLQERRSKRRALEILVAEKPFQRRDAAALFLEGRARRLCTSLPRPRARDARIRRVPVCRASSTVRSSCWHLRSRLFAVRRRLLARHVEVGILPRSAELRRPVSEQPRIVNRVADSIRVQNHRHPRLRQLRHLARERRAFRAGRRAHELFVRGVVLGTVEARRVGIALLLAPERLQDLKAEARATGSPG